ncbi:MAG TPA: biotin/lipoyl-containing protein, partial [Mycobacteriales bacterium]|nr:biotin/lipoyl-containing protein [Mycobacteriales bacterium]
PFTQVRLRGHAVEARIYAEDPTRDFLPSAGRLLAVREPAGPHVRVDSGVEDGTVVGTDYDPMLAKVIAWGSNRATAVRVLNQALGDTAVLGVQTNTALLRRLLSDPDVATGRLDTGLVERRLEMLGTDRPPVAVYVAAALLWHEPAGDDLFTRLTGWRVGEHAWTPYRVHVSGSDPIEVSVRGSGEVVVGDEAPAAAALRCDGDDLWLRYAGRSHHFVFARDGATLWLGRDGMAWEVRPEERAGDAAPEAASSDGTVRSPMPGTVAAVPVAAGDRVSAGAALAVVEAMKMEHVLTAPFGGTVAELRARAGQVVAMDEVLVVVRAD